jgi:hypothetical protein
VTSLKFVRFLENELETPHVVSYFFSMLLTPLRGSGQNVGRGNIGAERASRRLANFSNRVNAAGWTSRKITLCVEFDERVITFAFNIRPDVVYSNNVVTLCIVLQRPFIFCRINLAQVIDAAIGIPSRTAFVIDKIWYRNQSNKADEKKNESDLNYKLQNGPRTFVLLTHRIIQIPPRQFRCGTYLLRPPGAKW